MPSKILNLLSKSIISIYYRSKIERVFYYSLVFYRKSGLKSKVIYWKGFHQFYKEQKIDSLYKKYMDSLSFFKVKKTSKNQGILLIQNLQDYSYTIKLAAASKVIAEKNNLKVCMYDAFWMYMIGWSSEFEILYNKYRKSRFDKINLSFVDSIIFRTKDKYSDQKFIRTKLIEIKNTIKTKEDLVNMKIESVHVGDLIYDSYLRFYNRHTLEEINDDVLRIIEISLNMFYSFLKLIKKGKIKALINIYTCYIHHGITCRLCLEHDIDVYIIGHSNSVLIKKLEKDFPYHELNHSRFSPNRIIGEEALKLAEKTLSNRFTGIIDAATSYMRQSAYQVKVTSAELKRLFDINKRNIIIYVHDFFDAPHIDRKLQFTDYYQYLKSTLENLVEVIDTTVFVKIHPNGVPGCKEITIELVQSFNLEHFVILDENVSNLNIIELRPDLICTARGTVGVEMSYFEIPTVALFDNLYCNFNFVHTCYDVETYFKICRGEMKPVIDFDKTKLFSFYYQAYLEHAVKDEDDIIRQIENSRKDTFSKEYIEGLFSTEYLDRRNNILDYYKISLEKIEQEY